ncbi:uncharacterized protein [Dendropsophus ebraccatus]|uniref:uncharacterized protein n=1 Tax=Dendropsophus ebraccatus TaxID=150705 RepID=UPI0038321ED1
MADDESLRAALRARMQMEGSVHTSTWRQEEETTLPSVSVRPIGPPVMPQISSSVTPTKRQQNGVDAPVVWIIGHSYIAQAAQHAEVRPGGKNLGFRNTEVFWRGIHGLRWSQVMLEVIGIAKESLGPVILVIHVGGNDIFHLKLVELLTFMRSDVERFGIFFSKMILVWSEITPRVVWQGARDPAAAERARRTINARMSRFVRSLSGVVVRHRQFEKDNKDLMSADGLHLTEKGMDIFLSGLQEGIEQALFSWAVGASCGKTRSPPRGSP